MPIPSTGGFWRKMLAFAGPGYLVAVGYMDPGNWATDLAGGSRYGYTLLSVIMLSNLMAILLQALSARLGIASGRDLAQACRDHYSRPVDVRPVGAVRDRDRRLRSGRGDRLGDRAEPAVRPAAVLGRVPHRARRAARAVSAAVPLPLCRSAGRAADSRDRRIVRDRAVRWRGPIWRPCSAALLPDPEIARNPDMLYIAVGILGATVMPHNLYLHSSIVQTRKYRDDDREPARSDPIRDASIRPSR